MTDPMPVRDVLVHYHLFKNGGSSIERMLERSFGEHFRTYDRSESGARIPAADMQRLLEENPSLLAVSSHQLVPPLPYGDFRVTPIILLRHPLVRVRSAWLFEWCTQPGLDAPRGTLAEYVEDKFSRSWSNVIADFQVSRLGHSDYSSARQSMGAHDHEPLEHACRLLDALPFFGLVERFGESLRWMKAAVGERFPALDITEYRENVQQSAPLSRAEALERLRADLGDELYDELCRRNRRDLQLHAYAEGRFSAAVERLNIAEAATETSLLKKVRQAVVG